MGQKKNVKLEDIADELGISIVSVSNALKDKKGVSEGMRRRIKATAEAMGYHMAERRRETAGKTYMIGVLVAERYVREFPSYYMNIYKWTAQEAAKGGHMTVLEVVSPDKEMLGLNVLGFAESEIDGLVMIGELHKDYMHSVRNSLSVPIVCVDYYDIYDDMDYIITDGFGGMELMTQILLDAGLHDLTFVGNVEATKSITDRYLGYCKALEKAGIRDAQSSVISDRDFSNGGYHIDIDLPERMPDAFVCNCDKTANILLKKLRENGVRVPEDVSVVGFDNFSGNPQEKTVLTTYANDERIIAQISMNTLLKRIEGRNCPVGVRIVRGRVIEGNTVRRREGS